MIGSHHRLVVQTHLILGPCAYRELCPITQDRCVNNYDVQVQTVHAVPGPGLYASASQRVHCRYSECSLTHHVNTPPIQHSLRPALTVPERLGTGSTLYPKLAGSGSAPHQHGGAQGSMVCRNVKESQTPVQVAGDQDCGAANVAVHHTTLPEERKRLSCLPQTQRQVHAALLPRKLNFVH